MKHINHLFLYALVATCCMIEGVLTLSDFAVVAPGHLRNAFYFNGAFWPGLLGNWKANYAWQPYLMFFTHGFLHTGFTHLAVNMIALGALGPAVTRHVGQGRLILLFVFSVLGGGAGFALLADNLSPMVGASGGLFGLLGALLAWEIRDSQDDRAALWALSRDVAVLLVLSLISWAAMGGHLAWQAHLGGLVTGCIAATFFRRNAP